MERWEGGRMEWMERWSGWKDGRMEGRRWKDGKVERWKGGKVERWKNGWDGMGWDGKMERWKNGGDGKMERWKDGLMEGLSNLF